MFSFFIDGKWKKFKCPICGSKSLRKGDENGEGFLLLYCKKCENDFIPEEEVYDIRETGKIKRY